MSPVRDTNLNLSPADSDLPLIVTNVLSATTLDIMGTPLAGLCVRLNLAYTLGNTLIETGTLNVIIHAASSTPVASSDPIVGMLDTPIIMSSETAGYTLEKIIPFTTNYRYVRAEFALATNAASDSPAWSQVEAFVTENVGLDWDRNISFT
jgi:hypothetical protein